jgi:hypothetical protein
MAVIEKYFALFLTSDGVSPEGVRLALELERVPEDEKEVITLKIIAYATAAFNAAKGDKELEDGQKGTD